MPRRGDRPASANFRPQCVGADPPRGSGPTSAAATSSATRTAPCTCSRTTCGSRRASRTCSRTGRSPSGCSPTCSATSTSTRSTTTPPSWPDLLASLSPRPGETPTIVVLTPGIYNSAYFEHAFLAQQMGVHLVEGSDLVVDADDCVYMRTIDGLGAGRRHLPPGRRPLPRSRGVPARLRCSACPGSCGPGGPATWPSPTRPAPESPTTRSSTPTCPTLIRYYLDEDPIIPNVPTWLCADDAQRSHVLANLDELVVKPANESGGYGVFVGTAGHATEKDEVRRRDRSPTPGTTSPSRSSRLSTAPTLCDGGIVPRHLDLRPFVLSGERPYVTEGGLTRVAPARGLPRGQQLPGRRAARTPGSSTRRSCRPRADRQPDV